MIIDQVTRDHEANRELFRIVHEVAVRWAGHPLNEIVDVLRRELPGTPRLSDDEVLRIAEQIMVGRDPSGW